MFLTSLKQICNEYLIKFSENQSAPKLENRKTSPCSTCAPNLLHCTCSCPGQQDTTTYAALVAHSLPKMHNKIAGIEFPFLSQRTAGLNIMMRSVISSFLHTHRHKSLYSLLPPAWQWPPRAAFSHFHRHFTAFKFKQLFIFFLFLMMIMPLLSLIIIL